MLLAALASIVWLVALPAQAQTEIQWWHAMSGPLGERVGQFAAEFNRAQSDYKVVPVFKGDHAETIAAALAAFRAGQAPHLVQVREVDTTTIMSAAGAVMPLERMMKEVGEPFRRADYLPAVAGYYSSRKGELLSFPFDSSTTVFFFNKDALRRAGVETPPQTWADVLAAAAMIKASNATSCAFTSSWQSWTQVESFAAWHNVLVATGNNGFDSDHPRLEINSPVHVRHIGDLASWQNEGFFTYAGRDGEADARFASGECAMLISSSSAHALLKSSARFDLGVGRLPYYKDLPGAPQNTLVGGSSLWVVAGRTRHEYRGVARFLSHLARPEIQARWHQETGHLPATVAAFELTRKSGFYEKHPGVEVAVEQMMARPTGRSRGVRFGHVAEIRIIIDEELEGVWAGRQDARTALDNAVRRGNQTLKRFARTAGY